MLERGGFSPFDISDSPILDEAEFRFSGGGQGNSPRPKEKIRGSQHREKLIKKSSYPKPMPRPAPKPR